MLKYLLIIPLLLFTPNYARADGTPFPSCGMALFDAPIPGSARTELERRVERAVVAAGLSEVFKGIENPFPFKEVPTAYLRLIEEDLRQPESNKRDDIAVKRAEEAVRTVHILRKPKTPDIISQ